MDENILDVNEHPEMILSHHPKRQKTFHGGFSNPRHDLYTVGWICALHIEMTAARAMLDEIHEPLPQHTDDSNVYVLGDIKQHNVVIACLQNRQYEAVNTAIVATNMLRMFPRIRACLVVGIGGGVPSKADLRLGDVVVGTKVIHYDFGKVIDGEHLRQTKIPRVPHQLFGTVMSALRAKHELSPSRVPIILQQKLASLPAYCHPDIPDHLFDATCVHESVTHGCNRCDLSKLVKRDSRTGDKFKVHYGAIASGNQVIRSGMIRDNVAQELGVICFEMETASLHDTLPCLLIRGICDYSDSHRSKEWQKYAAATAAAYARELTEELSVTDATCMQKPNHHPSDERRQHLLDSLRFEQIYSRRMSIEAAHPKTCEWLVHHSSYIEWLHPTALAQHHGFLWIIGKPGVGKSTIMKFAYERMRTDAQSKSTVTASFFFNVRGAHLEKSIAGIYRSLLLQLLEGYPDLQTVLDKPELVPQGFHGCPSLNSLKDLFYNSVSKLGQRGFTCFVDALDECDEQQSVVDMVQFFEDLTEQSSAKGVPFRICFSSRYIPYITIRCGIRLVLEDQPCHTEDLVTYAASRLRIGDSSLAEELRIQLLGKAAGVFTWVVLVVAILNKEYRRGGTPLRLRRLAEMPSDLSELHQDITGRIPQTEHTSIAPPTDSGYASITHQKVLYGEECRTEYLHDVQNTVSGEGFSSSPAASHPRNVKHDDGNDIESIYTAGPGISPSSQQSYISEMVDDLFAKVEYDQDAQRLSERIHSVLPRLLKAFAIKFGQFGSTQMHRNIMVFIRQNREEIASSLRTRYLVDDQTNSQVSAHDVTKMDLGDIMDLWHQNLEDPDDDVGNPPDDNGSESSSVGDSVPLLDHDEDLPGLAAYKDLITSSPMYEWLLGSIRRELNLHPAKPNVQNVIRNKILGSLPSSRTVSRYDQLRIYQAKFTLNWNPLAFVKEQEYDMSKEGFLGKVITITGSSQDAEAMTCLQYLHQTWHSYGVNLLQLVEATLLNDPGYEYRCVLSDKTELAAWVKDENFMVDVTGIEDSIAEIGEQLAWLGSALRSSPHDSKISYCTPFLNSASVENASSLTLQAAYITKVSFFIDFRFVDEEHGGPPSPIGQCWHHLFRNPIVVTGFPIPYRSRQGTDLEIPLNVLAGLVQAKQIDVFGGRLFIKGFSSLLIPTEYIRDQGQMIWHLLYNSNGERISYLDGIEAHAGHILLADLEMSRHIIGWCSDARCYAGAAEISYSISRSWLRRPSSRCSLSNTFVSAGRLITGGDVTIYGNKDLPYRITRNEYIEKLSWVAKQYVVLWDAGEIRGWLVNGACALLHLLLASLHFNRTDPLGFAFQLNPTDIKSPEKTFTPRSAMEVLLNPDNLSLELYHTKEGEDIETRIPPVRIRDRVNQLYNILEKIMDHQAEITGRTSEAPRDMSRGNLEGWDFKDLATYEDPLYPRACKLRTKGKCWVDFTRAIRAPTLFGTGFGEILRPVDASTSCCYWSKLPRGKSYLAVSDGDLANIIDRFGNPNSNPVRLTHDLIWCNYANNAPRACKCIGSPEKIGHSELAQVILPSHLRKRKLESHDSQFKDWGSGAVVFGYNRDLPWLWKDTGFPEQEEASSSSEDSDLDSDDAIHDSGVGMSFLPPNTVEGSRELPLSRSQPESMTHEDYEVGIVCALSKELLAVRALFDSTHPELGKYGNDPNCYCLGRMKRFNVVAAGLPQDDHGTNSATNVASHLIRTFPRLKFCLVIGIGGGVPSAASDIRLGDVVIGTGVIQVDKGKWVQDSEFQMTAVKKQPPIFLRAVITKIQSDCSISFNSSLNPLLDDINLIASRRPEYQYPGTDRDMLFDTNHVHVKGASTCHNCTGTRWPRVRQHNGPNVFYGLIASGSQLVRDAKHRDRSGKENVICFEMEAAGVMRTTTNCLVIRGISDYADSHKNDLWQEYASATAAAYAKFFLSHMPESVDEFAVRVPSRLEAQAETVHLQKQKRAAPRADYDPPLMPKRSRQH